MDFFFKFSTVILSITYITFPINLLIKEVFFQAALNEVKVLSMLSHPNIIEYYENFLEDKALMIVMEYAEGKTTTKNDKI